MSAIIGLIGFGLLVALLVRRFAPDPVAQNVLVIDGDTIFSDGVSYRIHGIDAPEMAQEGGIAAKQHLRSLLDGEAVTIRKTGRDRYDRVVARLYTKAGDVGEKMVANGFARAAFHNDYRDAEARSKRKRRGLWATNGGIGDPGAFRRRG